MCGGPPQTSPGTTARCGTISRIWINQIAQENQWRFDCHGMVLSLRSNSFFKEKFRGRQFLQKYSKPLQHQRLKWEAGHKQPTSKVENLNKRCNKIKMSPTQLEQECRVIIESDEEIDQGFSYLLEEKGTDGGNYSIEVAKENTERY